MGGCAAEGTSSEAGPSSATATTLEGSTAPTAGAATDGADDAADAADDAAQAGEDTAEQALAETDVVGAEVPPDFPIDEVPLAQGTTNIGVSDMGSGDVYTVVIAGDGVVDAQVEALAAAGWAIESEYDNDNGIGGTTATTVFYEPQSDWKVELYGFDANFNVDGAPEQVAVTVWPSAYDE